MNIIFKNTVPIVREYIGLFKTTGWHAIPASGRASRALNNSLYIVCAYCDRKLVGVGRLTGDGYMYAYVNDMIVHPDYQKKGIGTKLLNSLIKYAKKAGIASLQLFSAKGKASFYRERGFAERPDNAPGMYLSVFYKHKGKKSMLPVQKNAVQSAKTACKKIISQLKLHANPDNVEGMKRYGISSYKTFGVSIPFLRGLAKQTGKNHELALALWNSGFHEARTLAGMVDEPSLVTSAQMDRWAGDFDSWDVCDQVCSNLFDKTPFAYEKAVKWSKSRKEFVRRAGYVMMAALSVHDKSAGDEKFTGFFPLITAGATDERNFVKKAVNWAVRQIGKRNLNLNKKAIALAKKIQMLDSKSARWIAADALRELERKMKNEE